MSLARVHNFSISLDGYGCGEDLSMESPFGHAEHRLVQWMMDTSFGRQEVLGQPGGGTGIDNALARQHSDRFGAEIMGAGKFGPPGWHDDADWKGWWGPNPPFHTPTFVLTSHPRPPLEMEGGTTFHFIKAPPSEALKVAQEAAGELDVRIGGGPTIVNAFLAAGLIDHMHIAVVPILLGRGVNLWRGLEGLDQGYNVEAVSSPSGVTHMTFTRGAP